MTKLNKKCLELSKDEFTDICEHNDYKDNLSIKKIKIIYWLEQLFGINRYEIDNININYIQIAKNELLEKVNELILLSDGISSKFRILSQYQTKINKINSNDRIKSFMADCYNMLGDIITVTSKVVRIKKTNQRIRIKSYKLN